MDHQQTLEILSAHGLREGRLIAYSKSGYCRRHPDHQIIFNAKLFTRRFMLMKMVDLDLTVDQKSLAAAAEAIGEDIFVVQECDPDQSMPLRLVLANAVAWTRTRPENQDVFLPVAAALDQSRRVRLTCTTGTWRGEPAYAVYCWENDLLYSQNTAGGAVELLGGPPKGMKVTPSTEKTDFFEAASHKRGWPVQPMFYQRDAMLEYIWFSSEKAVPAMLFATTVGRLDSVTYSCHDDVAAIHIRRQGHVIGLLWPCDFVPQETRRAAHQRLCQALGKARLGKVIGQAKRKG